MAPDWKSFPFKILPLKNEIQKKIAQDFAGHPSGLASCNHWGFKLPATVTETELENIYNYPLDPSDVWVVAPPKCGGTWTMEMVWLIVNNLDYEGAKTPLFPDRWHYMDFAARRDKGFALPVCSELPPSVGGSPQDWTGTSGDHIRTSPRYIKSHMPMSMNNPRLLDVCKVVYVARNPKDACTSYYHHCKLFKLRDFKGDLKLFVDDFTDGTMMSATMCEHMIEAWNLRHHPNMCFLFFEDMKRDLKSQIRRVATFFGKSYSDQQVEKLAEHLHIDNFKKNPHVNKEDARAKALMYPDRGNFVRQGKTGNWKKVFTPDIDEKFDKWMAQKMKSTDLTFVMDLERQD
ncbi:sulfotransferase 1C4-like [Pollicipes pollicipes]|uniref:sulfotransferase 1C4-like n=1 Tax=Pollicipes pollicipes TaxID=41117 RepID=UPI001885268B|nr:sulfotransferase 1C4-like [Pollicipes pollicipes]